MFVMFDCSPILAYDGLYDDEEIVKYPALAQWANETGGKMKACAPAAWTYLSDYAEPNIDNLLAHLGNNPVEKEVKTILINRQNPCFKVALMYSFYLILGTDNFGGTDPWYLSEPLLKKIYSGDQVMAGENLLGKMEQSLKSGMPAIVRVYGKKYNHVWLVTGMTDDRKFIVSPEKIHDFYNGDFGQFERLQSQMNFVNLREYDPTAKPVDTPEDIYGGDSESTCFYNSVIGYDSTRNNKWITSPSGKIRNFMNRYK